MVIPSYLSQFNHQLTGPESGRRWVFLHGLMGYGLNWRKIISNLETTERILSFDQRGHGRSIKPQTGYAPSDYAEDLYLITQELGWEKFTLVGHSMGGRNAISFAAKFPEKLEKLVIEDIGPESDPTAPEYYKKLLGIVPTPFADRRAAKDFFMNEFPARLKQALGSHENAETLGAYLNSNMEENSQKQLDWRFSVEGIHQTVLLGRAKDQWSELRSISIPTLVIRGQDSKQFPEEIFKRMCLSNPRIEGVQVPNAGHWVHSDQPQEVIQILRKFTGMPL